ncbi:tyrosine-type recombinase/integrase [Vibrio sp. S4M6]|uniref:tyrosine-type recombinase/integrase n=1 Tax=Vibrio sinus TaxID=2946865 RepID=UPI00202A55AD|nr:tyrosine-type recombinase/integrase [Vibrio sinus]MCL9783994.1 tyrosine-type recombinase/integrase [Vibrio sinus]
MARVYPVTTKEEIALIDKYLKKYHTPIHSDVWNFGLQVSLRISDILKIEFEHILQNRIRFIAQKTKKSDDIILNRKAMMIVNRRRESGDKYLFQSKSNRTGKMIKPISSEKIGESIRDAGKRHNLILGTHSMRKTWAYHAYKKSNDLALIQRALQHSTSYETLKYLGIEQEQLDALYSNLEL